MSQVAKYVYKDLQAFTNVVNSISTATPNEELVKGLWNSAILPVYFPYRDDNIQHTLSPKFTHGTHTYDVLVSKQTTDDTTLITKWTWVSIFQGRGTGTTSWETLRGQMTDYFKTSNHSTLYGIGAIGRQCKMWEWNPKSHNDIYQIIIDSNGDPTPVSGSHDPFDVVNDNLKVEKCITFIAEQI